MLMEGDANAQELYVQRKFEVEGNIKLALRLWHSLESLSSAPALPHVNKRSAYELAH